MVRDSFPPDAVERNIPGLREAEQYLALHRPEVLQVAKERNAGFRKEFGDRERATLDLGYQVGVICLARVLARHGSMAGSHYDYHSELHALDLMDHLRALYRSGAGRALGPAQWVYLAMFAGAHDLRQKETGYSEEGIGNNELASADEAMRIMAGVGFDPEFQQPVFQLLRWMIHGTTFFTAETQLNGKLIGPGALAPAIARRISNAGHHVGELSADQAAELVLLATDIDTANVAQSIDQYAEQSARLCREHHKIKGHAFLDRSTAESVLVFLTEGQEQYFFVSQKFHSQLAKAAFGTAKDKTGRQLKVLIEWLRQQYRAQSQGQAPWPTGETILSDFLAQSETISNEDSERDGAA